MEAGPRRWPETLQETVVELASGDGQLPVGLRPVPDLGLHVFLRTALKCPVHPTPVPTTEALQHSRAPRPALWNSFGKLQEQISQKLGVDKGRVLWLLIAPLGTSFTPISFHC